MRKLTPIAAIILGLGLTGAALADHERNCRTVATAERLSIDQFRQKVDALGYDLVRSDAEHNCIEAHLIDRSSGGRVKALFHATTGELVRAMPDR